MLRNAGQEDRRLASRVATADHRNYLISTKGCFHGRRSILNTLSPKTVIIGYVEFAITRAGRDKHGTRTDVGSATKREPVKTICLFDGNNLSRYR